MKRYTVAVPDPSDQTPGFRALVPALPWLEGELGQGRDRVRFAQTERRGPIAELQIGAPAEEAGLAALAAAGFPVLGDRLREGAPVAGGVRWRPESEPEPADWWPAPPWPVSGATGDGLPVLRISAAARRVLERGHPWLRPDPGCDDAGAYPPGTLVALGAGGGRSDAGVGLALVEGRGEIAARMWALGATRPREAPGVEARVARALAVRRELLMPDPRGPATDVCRLVHGEADGLPGWFVDRLGPLLRVVVTSRVLEPMRDRLLAALRVQLADVLGPDPPVVEVLCLQPRPAGRLEGVRQVAGPAVVDPLWVRERGLELRVESGLAEPDRPRPGFGVFPDMRANRDLAAERAGRGGRWLNLFAHTGTFSAALLAAGAEAVVSVDLSSPYLEILEANLDRNALSGGRHETVRGEVRRYLERLPRGERFAGIVLDPPTAAAAGRRFWSVHRDLEPLIELALSHLEPGGWLLAARNDRTGRGGARRLDRAVRRAAGRAGVEIETVVDAPPGPDFPCLPQFPEGDPFRAVWVRRASPSGNGLEPFQ